MRRRATTIDADDLIRCNLNPRPNLAVRPLNSDLDLGRLPKAEVARPELASDASA